MRKLILFAIPYLLLASTAWSDDCKFKYWEVIPLENKCEVFYLPDFDFRQILPSADANETIRRFCVQYEIRSKEVTKETGYCYTGEGDRTGPTFEIKGVKYLADIAFDGCLNNKPVQGIVFVQGGWVNAPKHIKRLWPIQSWPKKDLCAR